MYIIYNIVSGPVDRALSSMNQNENSHFQNKRQDSYTHVPVDCRLGNVG